MKTQTCLACSISFRPQRYLDRYPPVGHREKTALSASHVPGPSRTLHCQQLEQHWTRLQPQDLHANNDLARQAVEPSAYTSEPQETLAWWQVVPRLGQQISPLWHSYGESYSFLLVAMYVTTHLQNLIFNHYRKYITEISLANNETLNNVHLKTRTW